MDASVSLSVGTKILFRSQLFHPFSTPHAGNAKDDERNAQQLAHVENHARLEVYLYILGVFYEEAERENEGETQAEIETSAHLFGGSLVEMQHDEEEEKVGNRLVQLSWVAWRHVYSLKNKSPRHIGWCADNLAVHEVAQADKARSDWSGDGNVVEYMPQVHACFAIVQIECQHESYRTTVRSQSLVPRKLP